MSSPYVDGREAVPVQIIPQERIDQWISPRYLSVEECEIIFDMKRCGAGVREIARHLGRSAGTISKEFARNRDEFGLYLLSYAHRQSVLRQFRPKSARWMPIRSFATQCGRCLKVGILRSRFPEGYAGTILAMTLCMCVRKLFINHCSSRPRGLKKEIAAALRRGHT